MSYGSRRAKRYFFEVVGWINVRKINYYKTISAIVCGRNQKVLEMKKCSKCGKIKSKKEFSKNSGASDGLRSQCKECRSIAQKKYRSKHKKERAQYKKRLRARNRSSGYTPPKFKRCSSCKKVLSSDNFYRNASEKDGLCSRCKDCKWRRELQRRFIDPQYRMAHILRNRLTYIFRRKKTGSAVKDLGCSLEYFIKYMESKFYPHPRTGEKMTWENHGEWHVDHIVPLAAFDLTKRDHVIFACHYTNLQPLWAEENLSKGAKLDWAMQR